MRLPDKLMSYLNAEIAPECLYWNDGGDSFSVDISSVQAELLNKCFKGMKLSSFTRSLNRWGIKRIFRAPDPKKIQTYQHPCFRRSCPEGVSDMTMVSTTATEQAAQATRGEDSSCCVGVPTEFDITSNGGSVSSMDDSQSSPEPRRKKCRHSVAKEEANHEANHMINQLKEMGTKLQVAMEEFNKKHKKDLELAAQTARKTSSEEQEQQQILAIQALIANQRAMNIQRGLGINTQADLCRIIQSSTTNISSGTTRSSLPSTNSHSPSASYLAASVLNIMSSNIQQNAGRKP